MRDAYGSFSIGGGHNGFTAHEQRENGERFVLDIADSENLGVGPLKVSFWRG